MGIIYLYDFPSTQRRCHNFSVYTWIYITSTEFIMILHYEYLITGEQRAGAYNRITLLTYDILLLVQRQWTKIEQHRGPFHQRSFHSDKDFWENSFCTLPSSDQLITEKCSWRDSYASVACTKDCNDLTAGNDIIYSKDISHRIGITAGKSLVTWSPGNHEDAALNTSSQDGVTMNITEVTHRKGIHTLSTW